jgi:methyl-accepting chemotaxis protein
VLLATVVSVLAVLAVSVGLMMWQLGRFRTTVTTALQDLEAGRPIRTELGRHAVSEMQLVARSLHAMQQQAELIQQAHSREAAVTTARAARVQQLEEAVSTFEREMTSVVAEMDRGADDLGQVAGTLAKGAACAGHRMVALSESLDRADASVSEVASNSAEMARSIAQLSRRLEETFGTVRSASTLAQTTNASVDALTRAADRIGQVVALIRSIAEQTNLLALNATIEAARAGESGRGFAVVANEVKSLAGRTAQATEEISAQIEAIQRTTGESVGVIRAIVDQIGSAEVHAGEMSVVIAQQNSAVEEMAACAQMAREHAIEVKQDAGSVREEIGRTDRTVIAVEDASRTITHTAKRIDGAVRQFLDRVAAA